MEEKKPPIARCPPGLWEQPSEVLGNLSGLPVTDAL